MKLSNKAFLKKLQHLKEDGQFIRQEIATIKTVLLGQHDEETKPEFKSKDPTAKEQEADGDAQFGAQGSAVIKEGVVVCVRTNPYRGRTGAVINRRSKQPKPNRRTYWHIQLDCGNGSKREAIIYKMEKYLAKLSVE